MSLSSPELGPVTVVGRTSGGTQSAYKPWLEGKVIRKLTVWEQANRMRGIKLWKSGEADNGGQLYGSASGTASTFDFQPGELITSLSLWLGMWDYVGDRAGRIEFTTNLGNSFKHGYTGGSGQPVNVYSGILVGVQVRAGDDINAWGFGFLRPLLSCQLKDVTYTNLSGLGTIQLETLDALETSVAGKWSFTGTKSKKVSSSWSETEGVTTTIGFTVSSGIPGIFEVEEKFEWQTSESYTVEQSFETEHTLSWSLSGTLASGESVGVKALTRGGTVDVPYKGTLVVKVDTGATFSFPQSGTYKGVAVTAVQAPISTDLSRVDSISNRVIPRAATVQG